jgi:hypothetical protein
MRSGSKFSVEQLQTMLIEHMSQYQVSLGTSSDYPIASGTFIKFNALLEDKVVKVYGIFTAKHVLDDSDPKVESLCKSIIVDDKGRQFIVLSKLIKNVVVGCLANFPFFYAQADRNGARSSGRFDPDLGFICIGFGKNIADHELLNNSKFYDLDENQERDLAEPEFSVMSGFYRGADEVVDKVMLAGPYTGGGECLAYNQRSKVHYWKLQNPQNLLVHGSSGAGFWRLSLQNNIPYISLGGTIVCLSHNQKRIHATAAQYLYECFLPELKQVCEKELSKLKNH